MNRLMHAVILAVSLIFLLSVLIMPANTADDCKINSLLLTCTSPGFNLLMELDHSEVIGVWHTTTRLADPANCTLDLDEDGNTQPNPGSFYGAYHMRMRTVTEASDYERNYWCEQKPYHHEQPSN